MCSAFKYLSFALSYHFSKLNVFGYHFFNLIIHLANALLVWKLTLLTFRTPLLKDKKITSWAYPIAFFTGLIFVAHPIQTQAVTYIVQRTTSLAVFFYLASFVLYVQSRLTDKKVFYAGSLIAAILAMFLGLFTDKVIVVSESVRDQIVGKLKIVPANKCAVIKLGFDLIDFLDNDKLIRK